MALIVASCVLAFFVYHWLRYRTTKGPVVLPILGSIPEVLVNYNRFYDWITDLLLKFGMSYTVIIPWVPSMDAVVTCSPENVEHITKVRFANYPKGPPVRSACMELLGEGIFNSDGKAWRLQRRVAALEFNSRAMVDSMKQSIRNGVSSKLMPVLHHFARNGQAFDLQDVLLRYTFDNVCTVACGVDTGSLTPELVEVPFVSAMSYLTEVSTSRFLVPPILWKTKRSLRLGDESKVANAANVVNEFAAEVIRSRRGALMSAAGAVGSSKHTDLLTTFMHLCDSEGKPYSDVFLRDVVTNFILAGRDTSAVALTWFFWLLDSHPAVEQKIVQEIAEVLRSRTSASDSTTVPLGAVPSPGHGHIASASEHNEPLPASGAKQAHAVLEKEKNISECDERNDADSEEKEEEEELEVVAFTMEELKRMHFLHAALTESLRLYPSLPMDIKYAEKEDTLPDGTHVPAGFRVFYSIYAMARMPQIWGPDCLQFKPERWLNNGIFSPESQFKYVVFNAGPRLCLGKDMAYMQMKSVAAAVLRRYHVRVQPGHTVQYRVSLTLFMKYGLLVTLQKRHFARLVCSSFPTL